MITVNILKVVLIGLTLGSAILGYTFYSDIADWEMKNRKLPVVCFGITCGLIGMLGTFWIGLVVFKIF